MQMRWWRRGLKAPMRGVALGLTSILMVTAPAFAQQPAPKRVSLQQTAPSGQVTAGEASRFLAQASFGATLASIQEVQRMGFGRWMDWQMQLPIRRHEPLLETIAARRGRPKSPSGRIWSMSRSSRPM